MCVLRLLIILFRYNFLLLSLIVLKYYRAYCIEWRICDTRRKRINEMIGKLPYISTSGITADPCSSILLSGPNGPTLTRAHVHVRHINYNDFLPLMLERDLNYRYPLREGKGRKGGREKESEKEKRRTRWGRGETRPGPQPWLQGAREHFRNQTRVITLRSQVNLVLHPPPVPVPSSDSFCLANPLSFRHPRKSLAWIRLTGKTFNCWLISICVLF